MYRNDWITVTIGGVENSSGPRVHAHPHTNILIADIGIVLCTTHMTSQGESLSFFHTEVTTASKNKRLVSASIFTQEMSDLSAWATVDLHPQLTR